MHQKLHQSNVLLVSSLLTLLTGIQKLFRRKGFSFSKERTNRPVIPALLLRPIDAWIWIQQHVWFLYRDEVLVFEVTMLLTTQCCSTSIFQELFFYFSINNFGILLQKLWCYLVWALYRELSFDTGDTLSFLVINLPSQ